MEITFTLILDLLGTFAFAVSGIRLASKKEIDWFGAFVIGLVTAIGGGSLRDILLDVTPFWITNHTYFLTTAIALAAVLIFKERLLKWNNTLFIFDTIGLGLFTIVGITKSVDAELSFGVCIAMGAITGTVGGVIRDILLNEVPLLFKKDIYALACIAGGLVYFGCIYLNFTKNITEVLGVLTVILIRLIAVKYHIHLPQMKPIQSK